jgi:hypothetical protein
VATNGWGIFKLLAHEDIPEGDNLDGASRGELSSPESVAAGVCMAAGGCLSEALGGKVDESADSESIPQLQRFQQILRIEVQVRNVKLILQQLASKAAITDIKNK